MEKVCLLVANSEGGCKVQGVYFLIDKNDIDNFLRICKENHKFVEIELDYTEEN